MMLEYRNRLEDDRNTLFQIKVEGEREAHEKAVRDWSF